MTQHPSHPIRGGCGNGLRIHGVRAVLLLTTLGVASVACSAPVHLVTETPVQITNVAPDIVLVDFGRVAFGNVRIFPPTQTTNGITLHFGEALTGGRVDRKPPGTVRYATAQVRLDGVEGADSLVVAPPANTRNTQQPAAVLTPPEWGVVLPFRWLEIEGWPGELSAEQIVRQAAFASTWNDDAARFECSDEMLNRIWELCRYSIKATTFAGVYVDGDRERIPYEADAYLNQLSHYATDNDTQMARDTFDRLMEHPTWPTEWAPHMVFMAYADWMHTGDIQWLAPRYEALKTKLLLERAGPDGLIQSKRNHVEMEDIVDWPATERDGYVFTTVNTVVNAFHLRALTCMADLARALGNKTDAVEYATRERQTRSVFQEKLFNTTRGLYRDGEGTEHISLHANVFPLAFNLVPAQDRTGVTRWVAARGMACSVYAAQYLLEGLFENNAGTQAIELITARTDRSWRHMVESGTTITWEAWDQKYKPNQDWNHAWGAAPANLLPRYVLGAKPLMPGWQRALIRPNPGNLSFADGKIPTPRGPILVSWKKNEAFQLSLTLPPGMSARVEMPATSASSGVFLGDESVPAQRSDEYWLLDKDVSGSVTLEAR